MRIHFIGIGGIGVSALAKYYISSGAKISGSDLARSEITDALKKLGVKIVFGKHKATDIPKNAEKVIYTSAISPKNPEILGARNRGLIIQSYPEALGELTKEYKTITVSGSHGKSTTTAMCALVLEEGHFDPTVIIGTKMKEFKNSNFRKGSGEYLLLEADEWNKSFLHYSPQIAIVTNIDAEHLDTYKTVGTLEKVFEKYLKKVPPSGKIIANADDPRAKKAAKNFGKKVVWYSMKDKTTDKLRKILKVPGEHNVSNALAALALGRILGMRKSDILRALARFSGTWRRFEFKGTVNGAQVFTDYGHHPAEIRATIQAARSKFPRQRIWCVYQPHQYQRLAYLWKDFIGCFDSADVVCLLPVYDVAGRETVAAKRKVNSEKLAAALEERGRKIFSLKDITETIKFIKTNASKSSTILIMGAGDIYQIFSRKFLD